MGELLLIAKVLQAAYQVYQTAVSLLNPDPTSVRDLYNRIVALEIDVAALTTDVQNLTYELRRAEVIEITREVDAQRAATLASMQYTIDHPGDTAGEVTALTSANALSIQSFYTFPGRTDKSPDRFDPRAALPSFLEAVNTWLVLRRMNHSNWTDESRNAVLGFASRLDDIVAAIRGGVVCVETYSSYDHPLVRRPPPPRIPPIIPPDPPVPPEPPPTEPRCHHTISCLDRMREATEYLLNEDTRGYCANDGSEINPTQAGVYLNSYYMPDKLQQISQGWRAF